jgi:hypothetical protein
MNPYGRVRQLFGYMILSAPNFPAEDETDVDKEFVKLFELLAKASAITKNADKRQWIDITVRESNEALGLFKIGKDDEGLKVLQSASFRFDNVTQGKKHVVNFIVGADGTATSTGQDEGGIKPE